MSGVAKNTAVVDLTALASRINAEHRACDEALREGLRHSVRAGEMLLEAKGRVRHGEWGAWVRDNFEGSARTAQAYMKVAREIPHLDGAKAQRVADLSFREALKELSAPAEGSGKTEALGSWFGCGSFEEFERKCAAFRAGKARDEGGEDGRRWAYLAGLGRQGRAGWFREVAITERVFAALRKDERGFDHWRGELLALERIVRPADIPPSRERFGLADFLTYRQMHRTIAELEEAQAFPYKQPMREGVPT